MQIRKSKKTPASPVPETRQSAEDRIARAAGTQQFRHRDPLYHVTENFQQTFDRIGRSHARSAAGGFSEAAPQEEAQGREQTQTQTRARGAQRPAAGASGVREENGQKLWTGNVPSALTRFSDTAFQRGAMSASVLNGTGKMMLVSCLKRTVGESGPKRIQQQTLLGTGSQLRNIPGRSPDQMVFNRSFAKGALGIVVDTLRDARRVVDSMADMARGTGELYGQDSQTLRTMYPFLDNSTDLALEAEYREKLAGCTDEREKPILQNALVQTLALKAKKAQMKNEFINKLRFLSDRATETLAELEAPGVVDELVSAMQEDQTAEAPENPDEGAEDDAPDGSENNGTGAAKRPGTGTRTTKKKARS
jgi:hypothetical protein